MSSFESSPGFALNAIRRFRSEFGVPYYSTHSRSALPEYSTRRSRTFFSDERFREDDSRKRLWPCASDDDAANAEPCTKRRIFARSTIGFSVYQMTQRVSMATLERVFSRYGHVQRVLAHPNSNGLSGLVEFKEARSAEEAMLGLQGRCIYNGCCRLQLMDAGDGDYGNQEASWEEPTHLQQGLIDGDWGHKEALPESFDEGHHSVLFVSGLNEHEVSPHKLFSIFGIYCDVVKVKIFFHDRTRAVIQTVDPSQAETARTFLDGVSLWRKTIKVVYSKFPEIQLTRTEETLAKNFEFVSYPLHRFKPPLGFNNLQNITAPCSTLFVSNLPSSATEFDLQRLFDIPDSFRIPSDPSSPWPSSSSESFTPPSRVKSVRFLPRKKSMAFVAMKDVQSAFDAIVDVHASQAMGGRPIIVNFSKVELDEFNRSGWRTYFRC